MSKYLPWLIIILFAADRLLKFLALKISGFFLIPDIFSFEFYKNSKIAFGIPISKWLLWPLIVLILVILIFWLIQGINKKQYQKVFAISFIIAGAVSNIFDRLFYGFTIDYFNFISLSMFNLADAMILAGIGLILFFCKYPVLRRKAG